MRISFEADDEEDCIGTLALNVDEGDEFGGGAVTEALLGGFSLRNSSREGAFFSRAQASRCL